jgi:multiple sugar transport system permease protein
MEAGHAIPRGPGARRGSAARRDSVAAFLFLAPGLLTFTAFVVLPVLASLVLSMTRWDLVSSPQFVGIENYVRLLGFHREGGRLLANDPNFWRTLGNTFFYMLTIPINLVLALAIANLLNGAVPFRAFFRTLYFLPVVCTLVAVSILWRWIFNPDFGLFNYILGLAGIHGPAWLVSREWSKPAIMIVMLWKGVGYSVVVYLAALQALPHELYEAARIDGAGAWRRFWTLTVPLLAPTHLFLGVIGVIWGFQTFDTVFLMTGGGPAGATEPVLLYLYRHAFQWFDMGYASAIAWVLFVLILAATLVQWRAAGARGRGVAVEAEA